MKAITTVGIDIKLKEKAKNLGINISKLIEDTLRNKINFKEQNFDNITKEKTAIEFEILSKKKDEIDQKHSLLSEKLANFDQKALENEKKRLENEEKFLLESKKCLECGNILNLDLKYHKFDKGILCNGCFLTAKDTLKYTNKPKEAE